NFSPASSFRLTSAAVTSRTRDLASSQSFSKASECFIVVPFSNIGIPARRRASLFKGRSRINDQAARILSAVTLWLSPALVVAQLDKTDKPFVIQPLAHTYSIAARDPEAGQLGAAAQSRRFSVFFPSS